MIQRKISIPLAIVGLTGVCALAIWGYAMNLGCEHPGMQIRAPKAKQEIGTTGLRDSSISMNLEHANNFMTSDCVPMDKPKHSDSRHFRCSFEGD